MTTTPPDRSPDTNAVPAAPLAPATVAVTAGRPPADPGQPLVAPIELSSTFHARDDAAAPGDPIYGRFANRTWADLEEVIGKLEGGPATVFASGMAAISAVIEQAIPGGTLVIPRGAYSNTTVLARKLAASGQLDLVEVDVSDTAAVLAAFEDGADVALLESPTNPLLDVADLARIAAGAQENGVLLAVDNTFATPLLQRPLDLGADVVIHSATKYLSGHSDVLLGVVVTRPFGEVGEPAEVLLGRIRAERALRGAIPGPFETWLALRGIRTLELRVTRAGQNAAELARRLADHPAVSRVRHPSLPADRGHTLARRQMTGFGAIVSIELHGGAAQAERLCAATRIWAHATSLGAVESSLERRRRQPTEWEGVPESLVRLSVGVEDVEDLWSDLDQALDASA